MADPTTVNGQITDGITTSEVRLPGEGSAHVVSEMYQAMARAAGVSMQNAVANQQNMNTISAAVTTQGVSLVYSLATANGGNEIFSGNALAEMLAQLRATVETPDKKAS